ncbi:alpha-amylase family glycosyl hydrolase [Chelatococcus reniformis]|uniref:Alpha-amylase n=1 Tax=Chelatococcus reniformis TaxID=1494448 RepID=A0A916XM34_9HYPH|nr:alpha-amylase family glycosyl hydrolase [Chelatococcus reniformis]GGC85453.1 alpha-amylase [Chelatococcus reniformis]
MPGSRVGTTDMTRWWQSGTIYQVYPRSFQDSDGDGIGDLEGIRQRLGHLVALGVDAVWVSPFYPSPMADFGYDVADYCGVDPMFGTLEDFDGLIADAHGQGLKVVLDFVPNHTSERHPWFAESRAGRGSAKRDWYIWRDPASGGGPPNNWASNFGGSAWEYDEASGQYYYHAFLKEQPDLNWRNPQVRAAMNDVLRFWLERGVDGFRVDVIWHLMKDAGFRDNPDNPGFAEGQPDIARVLPVHSADQPEVFDVIAEMRATIEAYGDRVLIGEIYLPLERLVAYYGHDLSGVHLPFNFQLILSAWNARGLAELIETYERALPDGGWPNWVLGNHDQHRVASRIGAAQARVAAMLLLTLRGTPTIYYGDEIGMTDGEIAPEAVQDPWEKNEPGLGLGRDPERTPMHWTAADDAGFTTGTPWLPVGPAHEANVADQTGDPRSMLALHRRLLALRRAHEALSLGSFESVAATGDVLAYRRRRGGETFLIVLNLGHEPVAVDGLGQHRAILSTHLDREEARPAATIALRPDEGLILVP